MVSNRIRKTVLAALVAELCVAGYAAAQTGADAPAQQVAAGNTGSTGDTGVAQVVVSGIRASLSSSLMTKRLQDGVVDAVSAEDAGKFPDTNIAESLQRVTGVQIQRNNGEGRYISVRGLGPEFNNVLVNGRTMTSDTGGREFSFDLLSSDLISKALVYKTSQAFLPEGGIGSTVDIQTARPLSGKTGSSAVVNASGAWDSNSKKTTPNLSGLYSYANPERTFGVTGSLSYTDRKSKQNKAITDAWNYRDVTLIDGDLNSTGLTPANTTTKKLYIPQSFGYQQEDETRKRLVSNLTVQYNPSERWKLTADALFSRLNQRNDVIAISDWINPVQLGVKYDGNNQITSLLRPGSTFYANNPALSGPGSLLGEVNSNDMIVKGGDRLSITRAFGLNSKWSLTPEWKLEGDVSTSRTSSHSPNMWIVAGMVPRNGDTLTFGSMPGLVFGDGIDDPNAVRAHAVSYGDIQLHDRIHEERLNTAWNHEIGWFKTLEAGVAHSQREVGREQYDSDAWNTFSGYHVALPSSLFTVTPLEGDFGGAAAPANYLRFDPYAYMRYLNQPALLAQSNDPAYYLDKTRYPNGPLAIDYTKPNMWRVKEKVSSFFVNTKWEGERWSADAGIRVVHVNSGSTGISRTLLSATKSPNDTTYILNYGPASTTTVENSYNSFLPSANVKFELTKDMVLRLAASKTETRPTLGQMGVDNWYGGRFGDVQTGGGNPKLKPMHSKNFDASYEWYLSKTNFVGADVFIKNVADFLETRLVDVRIPQYDEVVHDTRVRNGQTGKIKGAELSGQYMFDAATMPWLQGFGVSANYTYVDAKASRDTDSGTPTCGYPGLSPQSYNASVFFENERFQARASYNWRNHFSIDCGGGSTLPRNRAAYGQTDASLRFNVTPTVSLYLDAINLTNAKVHEYANNDSQFLTLEDDGRRVNFGVRMAF